MRETWRLLDTGVAPAAENMAIDQVVLTARSKGIAPTTLRLLRFSPPAVLVGIYQTIEEELRLDYCHSHGIDINRRLTGGGTIFFDESQLGWELIGALDDVGGVPSVEMFERLCRPTISALRRLGLDASYRPRNDIEIGGKKISGTGGTSEGNAFLFQGTLLTDFDVDTMLRVLRVPVEKLKRKEIESLRERVTCLRWELDELPSTDELKRLLVEEFEREFNVRLVPGGLTAVEQEMLGDELERMSSEGWIKGTRLPASHKHYLRGYARVESGVLKASIVFDSSAKRVEYVVFSGDFFAFPLRAIYDLEATLKGVPVGEAASAVERFFDEGDVDFGGLGATEFVSAVNDAIARTGYADLGIEPEEMNGLFSIVEPMDEVARIGATALLLPYCAKPVSCELRHTPDCTACGECDVGDAYMLAHELGLEVRTITSFENLMVVLADFKRRGVPAFVGSCCEAFYLKHRDEMEQHGVPGVLVDVGSDTCYDLGRTELAYAGSFEGETTIRLSLLTKAVRACARRGHIGETP